MAAEMNSSLPSPTARESVGLRIWSALYPILIFFAVQIVVSFAFVFLYGIYFFVKNGADPASYDILMDSMMKFITDSSLIMTLVSDALMVPLFALLYRSDKKKGKTVTKKPPFFAFAFAVILAAAANLFISGIITSADLTQFFPDYESITESLTSGPLYLQILAVAIVAPVLEEFLMRGLVLNRLRRLMPTFAAVLLQGMLFGVIHMNILQGSYAALIGFLLGYIYVRYESLLPCFALHITLNAISVLVPSDFGADWSPILTIVLSFLVLALTVAAMEIIRWRGKKKGIA